MFSEETQPRGGRQGNHFLSLSYNNLPPRPSCITHSDLHGTLTLVAACIIPGHSSDFAAGSHRRLLHLHYKPEEHGDYISKPTRNMSDGQCTLDTLIRWQTLLQYHALRCQICSQNEIWIYKSQL